MTEPQFRHLRSGTQQGVLVLAVVPRQVRSGDFELLDALRQEMLDAVGQGKGRKVAVDLSGVEYLGSGGFRPLLSLRKRLQENGGDMVLCGLGGDVREVLLTSRLINAAGTTDAPFGVAPDIAQAVARLSQPGKAERH
jgi:anti-anti-sigma factor